MKRFVRNWRVVWGCCLLGVPMVLLAVGCAAFLVFKVSALESEARRQVTMKYREIAVGLRENPQRATYFGKRQKGWRQVGTIRECRWGHEANGAHRLVWVDNGQKVWGECVAEISEPMDGTLFYWIGGLLVAALLLMTGLGIYYFCRLAHERDDFIAAAAHDLTTPLVGLRYMIGTDNDAAHDLNERLLRLVANIRDFLHLGGKRKPPSPTTFPLLRVLNEAYRVFADDYRDLFQGEDVALSGDVETEVFADETLTVQVLWNLFGNDLKYAAPYGRVWVMVRQMAQRVQIAFYDEGQGMTSGQMRRAFNRYYRARTVLKSGKGGFGIGLCTAREFARAMGGDLRVRPNCPRGCVFELYLPRKGGEK